MTEPQSDKLTKMELRKRLLEAGFNEADFVYQDGTQLSKHELSELYKSHIVGQQGIKQLDKAVEALSPLIDDVPAPTERIPKIGDADWTQYVLGQFLDDEIDGKNPRVEGLRRVAGELVGELIEEGCDLIAAPSDSNGYRACVKAWGVFMANNCHNEPVVKKRFEALADASPDNCTEDFSTYLVAMADTRAKGRVFRNALHLRRVVSAEEVNKTMSPTVDTNSGGSIHTGQIGIIRLLSDRMNLNIANLLDKMKIVHDVDKDSGEVNLKSISYEDAVSVTKKLNELRSSTKEDKDAG